LRTVISPMVNLMQKCFCKVLYTLIFLTNMTFQVCLLQLNIGVFPNSSWHISKFLSNRDVSYIGFYNHSKMCHCYCSSLWCTIIYLHVCFLHHTF
jgi:hypothetical protein